MNVQHDLAGDIAHPGFNCQLPERHPLVKIPAGATTVRITINEGISDVAVELCCVFGLEDSSDKDALVVELLAELFLWEKFL